MNVILTKCIYGKIDKTIHPGSLTAKKTMRPNDSNSITERTSDLVNDSRVS